MVTFRCGSYSYDEVLLVMVFFVVGVQRCFLSQVSLSRFAKSTELCCQKGFQGSSRLELQAFQTELWPDPNVAAVSASRLS